MKRKSFALLSLVFFLASCSPQSVEEAQVDFCQALAAYGQSVQALENISSNTTVDELQTAREDVVDARQAVVDSAADLRESRVRGAEEAWENVQDEIGDISGDATLGEAAATIRGQTLKLATEIERIRNISCGRR